MQTTFDDKTQLPAVTGFGGGEGEFNIGDFEVPQLFLVQGNTELNGKETPSGQVIHDGDFVLMGEYILPKKFGVTVVKHRKRYQQNISFDPDNPPKEYDTEAEVKANGGNLDWGKKPDEDPDNYFVISRINLMSEVGEDFPIALPFNDRFYTPARWKVKSSAFRAVVPRLNSVGLQLVVTKQPLASVSFDLSVDRENKRAKDGKEYRVYVPRLTKTGTNSPEFVEFLKSIF